MYWTIFGLFSSTEVASDAALVFEDGDAKFRLDVRAGYMYIDEAITEIGFDGVLGIDWAPIQRFQY